MRVRKYHVYLSAIAFAFLYIGIQRGVQYLSTPTKAQAHATTPIVQVAAPTSTALGSTTTTNALVTKVVDGDTIDVKLDGQNDVVRVRFLGVNTPETVDPRKAVECFGHEASAFTHQQLEGRRVRLDADVQADNMDKYGRILRNVVMEDGTDFNALLVKDGFAYAYLSFPLNARRKLQLKYLQQVAKEQQVGLWDPKTCNGKTAL